MNLVDLLNEVGGNRSLEQVARKVGVSPGDAGDLLQSVAPSLIRALQRQAESTRGMQDFSAALASGNHARYVDSPELMEEDDTLLDGNKILGHLFGSKDVSRNVAAYTERQSAFSASQVKRALPLLAGLLMGVVSKSTNGGRDLIGQTSSGFGSLLDLFLGGSRNRGLDDIISLARKFI